MTEQRWTTDELDRTGGADELDVRSFRGDNGRWYRAAQATGAGHATTTLRLVPGSEASA
jgi:hypothetical protein